MEHKRLRYKNSLYVQKKNIESFLERSDDSIKNIKLQNMSLDFTKNKIEKIKSDIAKKLIELDNVKQKIINVDHGLCDDEIQNELFNNQNILNKKQDENKKILDIKKEESRVNKERISSYWNNIKQTNSENYQAKKDHKYHYKLYIKAIETLPNYIKNNLKDMPNNKGYVWRGCYFFGELKPEHGKPDIIFEKRKGNILRIIVVCPQYKKVYEKQGRNKRVLVESYKR